MLKALFELRRQIGLTLVYWGIKLLPDEEERAQTWMEMQMEGIIDDDDEGRGLEG